MHNGMNETKLYNLYHIGFNNDFYPIAMVCQIFLYIPKDKELEFALVPMDIVRGLNSLLTFGSWTLWKHHIDYVFSGTIPSIQLVLGHILDKAHLYCFAGARNLGSGSLQIVAIC
jgi:hypothetical protein